MAQKEDNCEITMAGIDGNANKVAMNLRSVLPAAKKTFDGAIWFSVADRIRKEGLATALAAATSGNIVYIVWDTPDPAVQDAREIVTIHMFTGK